MSLLLLLQMVHESIPFVYNTANILFIKDAAKTSRANKDAGQKKNAKASKQELIPVKFSYKYFIFFTKFFHINILASFDVLYFFTRQIPDCNIGRSC